MLGLIKKDILVMKHQLHTRDFLIMVSLVIILFWGLGKYAMPIMAAVFLIVVSGYCNTIAICDARTQWDEYESILPVSIKKRVLARYIVCAGMLLLMLICLFFINFVLAFYSRDMQNNILLAEFYVAYVQMLVAIPISLKRGGEKSSYVLCIFLSIIALMCWGIKTLGFHIERQIFIISKTISLNVFLFIIIFIGTFISYRLSLKHKSHMN